VSLTIPTYTPEDMDDAVYDLPATTAAHMYAVLQRPVVTDITAGTVDGAGVFDKLMKSINVHLQAEYTKNRITGADYTTAYIALTQAALASSIQFVLGRDQAFWQAQTAQAAAITARVQLETARVTHAHMLPAQLALVEAQTAQQTAQSALITAQRTDLLPKQVSLTAEQAEAARAQTYDVRLDGSEIWGIAKKQKELYTQQVASYQRDAEVKAAKIFSDAWTVQKTMDEGLTAPGNFSNANIDDVLARIRDQNSLYT